MKNFLVENWYKLVLSVCLLICSVGFLIQSSKPVQAQAGAVKAVGAIVDDNGKFYVVWSDGLITYPKDVYFYRG